MIEKQWPSKEQLLESHKFCRVHLLDHLENPGRCPICRREAVENYIPIYTDTANRTKRLLTVHETQKRYNAHRPASPATNTISTRSPRMP